MRGLNIQRIVIEKEENEKLYKALGNLNEFRDTFDDTVNELGLAKVDALDELGSDIDYIIQLLGEFLDNLGYCDYIEIEG